MSRILIYVNDLINCTSVTPKLFADDTYNRSVVEWIERLLLKRMILITYNRFITISGRVDRASSTEAVDTGSIPGRVKPKTIKIGIHSFPA